MGVEVSDLLESEETSVEEIMRRIRAYIARETRGVEPVEAPAAGPKEMALGRGLYDALAEARATAGGIAVSPYITRTSLPVIGPMIDRLRRMVHELVLFYVNQMAARQIAFNTQIVNAVTALAEEMEQARGLQTQIRALERELTSLKAQRDNGKGA